MELKKAYDFPTEISAAKKSDLLELCKQNLIPQLYHNYFNGI